MIPTAKSTSLRFDGSVWCNLDIALRSVDQMFRQTIRPAELSVIEWYILRALFNQDGQHASELARAVGRAATSFTPNLDKLQDKGYIERRPDSHDRRAVRIFLTDKAWQQEDAVLESANELDAKMEERFSQGEMDGFQQVVAGLQALASTE